MSAMVDVIVPVYMVETELLERCLRSVQNQTRKNVETIIVFDGDGSKYQPLVQKLVGEGMNLRYEECPHRGVSAARNRGLRMAEGNWVAFLDADDWLEEDALEELCAFGEKQRADIVMASMENTGNPNNVFYRDVDTVFCGEEKPKFVADVLKPQTGAGFACGKIFKRALLAENKIFFNEALAAAEDAEFVFRTANAAERIAYIPKVGYHYWYNPNSAVRCYRTDYAQRYILAIDAVRQDMDDMGVWEQYREAFYSFVLYHLLLIAVNASFHPQSGKNMAEQLREFQKLLAENPFSEALQYIRYSDFSITRRAALLCIRTRFYLGVKMIAWVRHQQFRRIASRRVSV